MIRQPFYMSTISRLAEVDRDIQIDHDISICLEIDHDVSIVTINTVNHDISIVTIL